MTKETLSAILNKYGNHTFGVAMFLVLWFATIKPTWDRDEANNKLMREMVTEAVNGMTEQAKAMESTVLLLKSSIETTNATTQTAADMITLTRDAIDDIKAMKQGRILTSP